MLTRSEHTGQLAKALATARGQMRNPVKDQVARLEKYSYRYADLATVLEAAVGPLTANGLALVQAPAVADGILTVTTTLLHESGEWLASELACPLSDIRPQVVGSLITYLRRYSAQSLLGLAAEADDDAGLAEGSTRQRGRVDRTTGEVLEPAADPPASRDARASDPPTAPDTTITAAQRKKLFATARARGWTDADIRLWLQERFGVASSKDLPREAFDAVLAGIEAGPAPVPF